jgi:hypothetical protein
VVGQARRDNQHRIQHPTPPQKKKKEKRNLAVGRHGCSPVNSSKKTHQLACPSYVLLGTAATANAN